VQQHYVAAKVRVRQEGLRRGGQGLLAGAGRAERSDLESVSSQPPLSDLKMLATGFNDLAAKAVAPALGSRAATPSA
jgi:hypothetical protein